MFSENIRLTGKEILEKDFKSGFRGYDQDEVDQFLDLIIKDYETFQQEIDRLQQENHRYKKQLEEMPKKAAPSMNNTNYDILRRLSNLEKHVFGSKLHE